MSAVAERLSVAEYLERERASELRHEFLDGEVGEMTGGSTAHGLIAGNLVRYVGLRLEAADVRVFPSDVRVGTPSGLFAYPDATVVLGPPEVLDEERDTILNPVAIFEVLSPSTERFDRGRKFEHYRSIPSLREYVLVAQDRVGVEHFVRGTDPDRWESSSVSDVADSIVFESLGVRLPLSEIYAKVVFP